MAFFTGFTIRLLCMKCKKKDKSVIHDSILHIISVYEPSKENRPLLGWKSGRFWGGKVGTFTHQEWAFLLTKSVHFSSTKVHTLPKRQKITYKDVL